MIILPCIYWGLLHNPRTGNPVLNQPGYIMEEQRGFEHRDQLKQELILIVCYQGQCGLHGFHQGVK